MRGFRSDYALPMSLLVKFDELVLKIPGDELRLRFHPRMTILSGLGAPERAALSGSIVGALTGGSESTVVRYFDGTGRLVTAVAEPDGSVHARHEDDGSPAGPPVAGPPNADGLRALMLVRSSDVSTVTRAVRADEPPELRDARASLAEISAELEEALAEEQTARTLRAELADLDVALRAAHDGAARREYVEVLAHLERVRAEAATIRSGTTGADTDRHLLANADAAWALADRWRAVAVELTDALERFGDADRLDADERTSAATLPDEPPADLDRLIGEVQYAEAERTAIEGRLQMLAVSKLPAPSDLLVGELGLLDPHIVWPSADRLIAASAEMHRLQLELGGIGGDDTGPPPAVIAEMEDAHRAVADAEAAAEAVRVPGVAGSGLGVAIALAGTIGTALLIPFGLLITGVVGTVTLIRPRRRVAEAAAAERVVLDRAGIPSYLGFHLRRLDATMDPNVRGTVESASDEHRAALAAWNESVGPDVDVTRAKELEAEIRDYSAALRSLGGAADEIHQLRTDLVERAEPACTEAQRALADACAAYGLTADELADPATVDGRVAAAITRGESARRQGELELVEARERDADRELSAQLLQLGFDSGALDARLGALEWGVARAGEREEARTNARPSAVIEAELVTLEETARRLKRPEWATVDASEAGEPDIPELEARREKVATQVSELQSDLDAARLADRQSAIERRVLALEARHHGDGSTVDPSAIADIQQHLLARLTQAATAGAHGDPVPTVLDEVFLRVPAEHTWDLLDLLHRLSERHQLIYLSDDPFVAAWASQKASDVSLLAPEPEPV